MLENTFDFAKRICGLQIPLSEVVKIDVGEQKRFHDRWRSTVITHLYAQKMADGTWTIFKITSGSAYDNAKPRAAGIEGLTGEEAVAAIPDIVRKLETGHDNEPHVAFTYAQDDPNDGRIISFKTAQRRHKNGEKFGDPKPSTPKALPPQAAPVNTARAK